MINYLIKICSLEFILLKGLNILKTPQEIPTELSLLGIPIIIFRNLFFIDRIIWSFLSLSKKLKLNLLIALANYGH